MDFPPPPSLLGDCHLTLRLSGVLRWPQTHENINSVGEPACPQKKATSFRLRPVHYNITELSKMAPNTPFCFKMCWISKWRLETCARKNPFAGGLLAHPCQHLWQRSDSCLRRLPRSVRTSSHFGRDYNTDPDQFSLSLSLKTDHDLCLRHPLSVILEQTSDYNRRDHVPWTRPRGLSLQP